MERDELRRRIFHAHLRYTPGYGLAVLCPWCGEPVEDDWVLHEYLVECSAVPVDRQHLVVVPENCTPWHSQSCHVPYGQTREAACKSLWSAARALTARAIGRWYVSLWQVHGLSIPRGLLPAVRSLSPGIALRFFNKGAGFFGIPHAEIEWTYGLGGDVRALAILRWQGKRLPVEPPERWGKYPFGSLVEAVETGYWLDYLEGVIGA